MQAKRKPQVHHGEVAARFPKAMEASHKQATRKPRVHHGKEVHYNEAILRCSEGRTQ